MGYFPLPCFHRKVYDIIQSTKKDDAVGIYKDCDIFYSFAVVHHILRTNISISTPWSYMDIIHINMLVHRCTISSIYIYHLYLHQQNPLDISNDIMTCIWLNWIHSKKRTKKHRTIPMQRRHSMVKRAIGWWDDSPGFPFQKTKTWSADPFNVSFYPL